MQSTKHPRAGSSALHQPNDGAKSAVKQLFQSRVTLAEEPGGGEPRFLSPWWSRSSLSNLHWMQHSHDSFPPGKLPKCHIARWWCPEPDCKIIRPSPVISLEQVHIVLYRQIRSKKGLVCRIKCATTTKLTYTQVLSPLLLFWLHPLQFNLFATFLQPPWKGLPA